MDQSFSAENFLKMAENFCKSAKILSNNIDAIRPFPFASIFFCAGHSVELSLKASLIKSGKKEKDIKDYRHDLSKLIEDNEKIGFEINNEQKLNIDTINEIYKNHDFRYPNMEIMILPSHQDAIRVSEEILNLVKEII
jgi:HEPN domain-containing protein